MKKVLLVLLVFFNSLFANNSDSLRYLYIPCDNGIVENKGTGYFDVDGDSISFSTFGNIISCKNKDSLENSAIILAHSHVSTTNRVPSPFFSPYTLSLWLKIIDPVVAPDTIFKSGNGWLTIKKDNRVTFFVYEAYNSEPKQLISQTELQNNKWHNITIIGSGNTNVNLFLNGSKEDSVNLYKWKTCGDTITIGSNSMIAFDEIKLYQDSVYTNENSSIFPSKYRYGLLRDNRKNISSFSYYTITGRKVSRHSSLTTNIILLKRTLINDDIKYNRCLLLK